MGNTRLKQSPEVRKFVIEAIQEAVQSGARKEKACETIGISLRTIERWEKNLVDRRKGPKKVPHNKLTFEEEEEIFRIVNRNEFADFNPWEIVVILLDKYKMYIASESTIYRILKKRKLLKHRASDRPNMSKKPDPIVVRAPREGWCWDITYIQLQVKSSFVYLYLITDIFSRFIVYWEVHFSQSDQLSAEMITRACEKENIIPGELILHADNGGPMKGARMLATLKDLGVKPSFSRPGVSDDNPISEALFGTLKRNRRYPQYGFEDIESARKWVDWFVNQYNNNHLHSGIKYVTPASRHNGLDRAILEERKRIYEEARSKNPKRWSQERTRNWSYIEEVVLNKSSNYKPQPKKSSI